MKHKKWLRFLTIALCVTMIIGVLPVGALTSYGSPISQLSPNAISKPKDPSPDPAPADPVPPPEGSDYVLWNETQGVGYNSFKDAFPFSSSRGVKGGDTLVVLKDCEIDAAVSVNRSGGTVTIKAYEDKPVTIKRAEGFTGDLFSRTGNYNTTFAGPLTIDGNKVNSDNPDDWTTSGTIFSSTKGGTLTIGKGVTLTNR